MTVGGGPLLLGGVFQVKMDVFRPGKLKVHIFPSKKLFFRQKNDSSQFFCYFTFFLQLLKDMCSEGRGGPVAFGRVFSR